MDLINFSFLFFLFFIVKTRIPLLNGENSNWIPKYLIFSSLIQVGPAYEFVKTRIGCSILVQSISVTQETIIESNEIFRTAFKCSVRLYIYSRSAVTVHNAFKYVSIAKPSLLL